MIEENMKTKEQIAIELYEKVITSFSESGIKFRSWEDVGDVIKDFYLKKASKCGTSA